MFTSCEGTGSSIERGTEGIAASWKTTSAPRDQGRDLVEIADVGAAEIHSIAHFFQVPLVAAETDCR